MTKSRRSMLQSLLAVPLAFSLGSFRRDAIVEVLEHDGGTHYVTRWKFATENEATDFVLSLRPKLTKMWLPANILVSDVTQMELVIVSDKDHNKAVVEGWSNNGGILPFWSISNAWSYLSNIRVNGNPVARASKPGGISHYFIEPFIKGNPEIIREVAA